MSNSYNRVKNSRQKLKRRAVYVMGGKCQCCGYNKCITALEFHHINPEEKSFTIQQNTNRAWAVVREELKKTILVCANCHREIEQGLIDNESLVSSFDEEKAKEIDLEIERLKAHQDKYCKNCGAIISHKATLCPVCTHKAQRKVSKEPIREELKQQIRIMSMVKVGELYGVTDNAMRKWCVKLNLPSKASEIKSYTDDEWEKI